MADPKDLSKMSWNELYQMRAATGDPMQQAMIAPFEHRAYARETVADDPMMAPAMALAVPGYQLFKSLQGTSRTPASVDQLTAGLKGVGEGLYEALARRLTSQQ